MNNTSKFHNDFYQTYDSVDNAVDSLTSKPPNEIIALVLLSKARRIIEGFTDLAEWELIKGEIVDIGAEFENICPQLSNLIDFDLEAENYNKRHE